MQRPLTEGSRYGAEVYWPLRKEVQGQVEGQVSEVREEVHEEEVTMARKRKARKGGSNRAKFATAARHCHGLLRAGKLPKKGMFGKCMRKELK